MNKGNPVVGVVVGLIFIILLCFFAYTVYGIVYRAGQESDFAYLGDYTTFVNLEDNMSPEYEINDLIIAKRENYYSMSETIIYNYNNSYRLGVVVKTTSTKYYIGDSADAKDEDLNEITYQDIAGAVEKRIPKAGSAFKILTSTASLIIIAIMFLCYMMFAKEK